MALAVASKLTSALFSAARYVSLNPSLISLQKSFLNLTVKNQKTSVPVLVSHDVVPLSRSLSVLAQESETSWTLL